MNAYPPRFLRRSLPVFLLLLAFTANANGEFQAGAAVIDITPEKLPVLVNGGMYSRSVEKVKTRVNARALALSDGTRKVVIVVADSCMMPRPLVDDAKKLASEQTGIPTDHLLISATHTHTAPSSMSCLGTNADPAYVPYLTKKLAEAVVAAVSKLQPAKIGFGKADAREFTALRRWIRRPDRIIEDPFGNPTVRANMHSGRKWEDVTGESGPEDPDLSMISVQTAEGKPLAVLANFSMHYFGDRDISADYFGLFCEGLKQRIGPKDDFVGIISHGCSGDIWRRDYTKPESEWNSKQTIDDYTRGLLDIAMQAYLDIQYKSNVDLSMAEKRMTLAYRVPNKQMLQWAQGVVDAMGDRLPKTTEEVYAREQLILHERQKTEIVVQGLRIGDIGIATTPNETYAITGLKIKKASPLGHTMVIELANGGDGYIPPPEQHLFGGYNTWAARSAGLEVTAEPKIAEACIQLLEKVSGEPRESMALSMGPAAKQTLAMKPTAYWRLNEFAGPHAKDSSENQSHALLEDHVTYFLEGPHSTRFCQGDDTNRAAMFVGGRMHARLAELNNQYSVSLWIWNGLPTDARPVTGWMFSRGRNWGLDAYGDHLGLGGKDNHAGRLIFFHGDDESTIVAGKTSLPRWQWSAVTLVRDDEQVRVYLNGKLEIETETRGNTPANYPEVFLGGRCDNDSNWEGRLDEIAVFDRALSPAEIQKLAAH